MLSSQSPTVVARDGRAVLVTGSPGGRTIINTVLSVVLGVLEYGLPLDDAVAAPRMHQPWFPDEVQMEKSDEPGGRRTDRGARADGAPRRAASVAAGRRPLDPSARLGPIGVPRTGASVVLRPDIELTTAE